MIKKIDTCKIEHKPIIVMFIWNYNNPIKNFETNHEDQLKIIQILNDKI